ncbi:MAG: histidine kinase [Bacteroidota bacterium]
MRKHLLIVVSGFALGVLFYLYHAFRQNPTVLEIMLNGILGVVVSYAFHAVNQFLDRTVSWKRQTGVRLLLGILIHLLFGMGLIYAALSVYEILYSGYDFFFNNEGMVVLKMAILLFCVVLIYNIIYFAFYSYQHYVKGQLLESQIRRKQTELQLKALKSQLSPHFLFNCLNALSTLVTKDSRAAETFIRSLAKSYLFTLKNYQTTLVNLSDELEFVKSYYFLIKTRFQEQITLDIDIAKPILETQIPPMTLQMLVENAIKHNVADIDQELQILIRDNDDFLEVVNNITKKRTGITSTKIGLKNIESRYGLLTKTPMVVENESKDFCVKIPILR